MSYGNFFTARINYQDKNDEKTSFNLIFYKDRPLSEFDSDQFQNEISESMGDITRHANQNKFMKKLGRRMLANGTYLIGDDMGCRSLEGNRCFYAWVPNSAKKPGSIDIVPFDKEEYDAKEQNGVRGKPCTISLGENGFNDTGEEYEYFRSHGYFSDVVEWVMKWNIFGGIC